MNLQIQKLYEKTNKAERLIIGLMSGTSMDGLDIALCNIKGSGAETEVKILKFKTGDYTDDFRAKIKAIFSKKEVEINHKKVRFTIVRRTFIFFNFLILTLFFSCFFLL
ncbi:MAG: hypothetical protein EOO44_19960 [Flavobacterium sp.]|nr:MAG: hypothetical protein EOO44_19960 [Flavobacterium sp.]